jgi:hypothetical protein
MLRLEIQKRFERIDERKELAGVPPTRGGLPRLLQLPLVLGWPLPVEPLGFNVTT